MKAAGWESWHEWCHGWMVSVKRKDRLRVRLEVVPHFHSHSSSAAHALSVTVTSVPPLHSCTRLWRRSALLSFIRGRAISVFPSGRRAELTWNVCGRRRRRKRRKHSHVWLHPNASDFRSCLGRDRSSHTQPSPGRLNNFSIFSAREIEATVESFPLITAALFSKTTRAMMNSYD